MYNRNYGGFDYVRIHSELLKTALVLLFSSMKLINQSKEDRCNQFQK